MDDAGAESSIHRDVTRGVWVHVASRGFGATTVTLRTARGSASLYWPRFVRVRPRP